jgi:hypothetical protein
LVGIDQEFMECTCSDSTVIEFELQLQSGEKALHYGVVPAAALGAHAADDLLHPQQVVVVGSPVLAALICVEEQLLRLHLPVAEGPVGASTTRAASIR